MHMERHQTEKVEISWQRIEIDKKRLPKAAL